MLSYAIYTLQLLMLCFFPNVIHAQSCYQQYFNLGMERYELAQYDKAANNFEYAAYCNDVPPNADCKIWQQKALRCYRLIEQADILFDNSNFEKAQKLYQDIAILNSHDKHARERLFMCERLITAQNVDAVKAINIKEELFTADGAPANSSFSIGEIKICFTLTENDFIIKGDKATYILITDPNGLILSEVKKIFIFKGLTLNYSGQGNVDYQGVEVNTCVSWKRTTEEMTSGTYYIDVFFDENIVGTYSFDIY